MDIASCSRDALGALPVLSGEPRYRADQVFSFLHQKAVWSYDEMTSLPKSLRESLRMQYPIPYPTIVDRQQSALDGTIKYLLSFADGSLCECVRMSYDFGDSLCISTQVGCKMRCAFCASGILGFERNLSAGEMLGEVYAVERAERKRVSGVVLMGTGEPLDNIGAVKDFLRLISDPEGRALSGRAITISTCGLVPAIYELADAHFAASLALSLHAPTDEIRREIMPVASRYSIDEVLRAVRYYAETTGRRATIEYILMKGINASIADARMLGELLSGFPCLLNLIPVNAVREKAFVRPGRDDILRFKKKLEEYRINVTIRREMGSDIDGACGQLRLKHVDPGHLAE